MGQGRGRKSCERKQ